MGVPKCPIGTIYRKIIYHIRSGRHPMKKWVLILLIKSLILFVRKFLIFFLPYNAWLKRPNNFWLRTSFVDVVQIVFQAINGFFALKTGRQP